MGAGTERLGNRILIPYPFSSHPDGSTKLSEVFRIPNPGPMGHNEVLHSCFSLWERQSFTSKSAGQHTEEPTMAQ